MSKSIVHTGKTRTTAGALAARAHQICPCSRATRGNIAVEFTIA